MSSLEDRRGTPRIPRPPKNGSRLDLCLACFVTGCFIGSGSWVMLAAALLCGWDWATDFENREIGGSR